MNLQQWAMLMLLSLLWGSSFFLMKTAALEVPILTLVFVRVGIGAIVLLLYLVLSGVALPRGGSTWWLFICVGIFNNLLPFSLLLWGMTELASGLAAILNATTPIFTMIVAHLFTEDEKINFNKLVGIVLGVLGVAVLIGFDFLAQDLLLWPTLACLTAALSYAVAMLFARQFKRRDICPCQGAFGQVTVTSLLLLPFVYFIDLPNVIALPSEQALIALLCLGVLSTGLASVLFFTLIQNTGATNSVLVTLLVPVSAVFIGYMAFGEILRQQHFLGMAIIGFALLLIDGRLVKVRKINPKGT